MGGYNGYPRAVLNTPHPMYGMKPGFGVGDLPTSYRDDFTIFSTASGDQTSPAISLGVNMIELNVKFSDLLTTSDLIVLAADGVTVYATFSALTGAKPDDLYVGFADQRVIPTGPFIFKLANFSGPGTVTVKAKVLLAALTAAKNSVNVTAQQNTPAIPAGGQETIQVYWNPQLNSDGYTVVPSIADPTGFLSITSWSYISTGQGVSVIVSNSDTAAAHSGTVNVAAIL